MAARYPKDWARSIPAHAGEPVGHTPGACIGGVYPRPRGGTAIRTYLLKPSMGLSPPTRGNPVGQVNHAAQ